MRPREASCNPCRLGERGTLTKLVVFDLENTLIFNEFLPELAALIGQEDEVAADFREAQRWLVDQEPGKVVGISPVE